MKSNAEKGNFFYLEKNYLKAIIFLEKVVKNINKRDEDKFISLCIYNLAKSYYEVDRFNDSINLLRRNLFRFSGATLEFNVYRLLGLIHYKKGEYLESLRNTLIAKKIIDSKNVYKELDYVEVHNDLGNLYSMFNEYEKAIEYRLEAIRKVEMDKSYTFKLGLYYNNLGVTCNKIIRVYGFKNFKSKYNIDVHSCFIKAIKCVKVNTTELGRLHLANIYNNLSRYLNIKNDRDNELYYLKKSVYIIHHIKVDTRYYIANFYLNLGSFYYRGNHFKKALKHINSSLRLRLNVLGYDSIPTIKNYLYIGNCYRMQNQFIEALKNYQTALDILAPGKSKTDFLKTPDVSHVTFLPELIEVLQSKSMTLYSIYKIRNEVKYLQAAYTCNLILSKLIDNIRKNLNGIESKSLLSARALFVYENSINITLDLDSITNRNVFLEKAFEYIEKCKALTLLETINENEAKLKSPIPDELSSREDRIKTEINFKQKQIFEEKRKISQRSNKKIKELESELFNLKEELDKVLRLYEKNFKLYYNLKYDFTTVQIVEIQSRLNKYDTLMEYFTGEENIFIFIITKNDASIHRVPKSKNFDRKLKQFRKCLSLSDSDTIKNDFQKFSTLSHYFYKLLVRDYIPEDTQNLIVIPDGLLNYISFEVLITEKPDTGNFKNVSYLLEKYNISYSYSATLLLRNLSKSRSKSTSKPKILGFAPSFNKESKTKVKEDALRSGLNSLKWNTSELKTAKKYFGGRIFLDEKAGKKQFVMYSADYPVLHLATHGIVEDKNPMFSKIAFAPVKDNVDDGYLHTYELYGMKLNSDLTILSACDTGYGKLIKGEGVMSIARGFLYAGSKSIMMSLWQVSDSATCKIIGYFYRYLSKGMSKNEALRKAKLDYIKNSDSIKANPAYWAPFVLIGNTNPL